MQWMTELDQRMLELPDSSWDWCEDGLSPSEAFEEAAQEWWDVPEDSYHDAG